MKKILIALILTLIATSSYAAQITITIPDAQVVRVKSALLSIYPNTECDMYNQQGVCTQPRYTDNQWLKEVIRRWVRNQVKNVEQHKAQEAAKNAVPTDHNDIIQ